jgi:hypothetical protein
MKAAALTYKKPIHEMNGGVLVQAKHLTILFTAIILLFSCTGCLEEKISKTEVLNRTTSAIEEATSYSYDMRLQLDFFLPDHTSFSAKYKLSAKTVIEPHAEEIDLSIEIHDQEMDMKLYLVDDSYYLYIPELGWSKQDVADVQLLSVIKPSQFKVVEMLKAVQPDLIRFDNSGEDMILYYKEQDGVFTNHIKLAFLEQVVQELMTDVNQEALMKNFTFENFVYELTIDSISYLPKKEVMQYQLMFELMDDEVVIYNTSVTTYQGYDSIKTISVPDEAKDLAWLYE